jgi:hypothetical protein
MRAFTASCQASCGSFGGGIFNGTSLIPDQARYALVLETRRGTTSDEAFGT